MWDELPRTGLPEYFESWGEYRRHASTLVRAGIIEDATKIWWDIRPSARFPTLEMRVADVCTRLDDAVTHPAIDRSGEGFPAEHDQVATVLEERANRGPGLERERRSMAPHQ